MKVSKAINQISLEIRGLGLPMPVREYRFHLVRKWRFDMAWPDYMVALEYEGGLYVPGGGGHQSIDGFTKDCVKYTEASLHGWRVIRVCRPHLDSGEYLDWIKRALEAKTPAG